MDLVRHLHESPASLERLGAFPSIWIVLPTDWTVSAYLPESGHRRDDPLGFILPITAPQVRWEHTRHMANVAKRGVPRRVARETSGPFA
jgi:hypothetical protein